MITGIILASGFSKRMGQDKLLLKLNDKALIETVIESCKESDLDKVIVIYRRKEIRDIADKYKTQSVLNSKANLGQSESIKLGVLSSDKQSDFMFLMGDQPFIDSKLINNLIERYKIIDKNILVPYYNSKKGMPSIFRNRYREELLNIQGDKGGRDLLDKYVEDVEKIYFENEKLGKDIDTQEDLEVVRKWI